MKKIFKLFSFIVLFLSVCCAPVHCSRRDISSSIFRGVYNRSGIIAAASWVAFFSTKVGRYFLNKKIDSLNKKFAEEMKKSIAKEGLEDEGLKAIAKKIKVLKAVSGFLNGGRIISYVSGSLFTVLGLNKLAKKSFDHRRYDIEILIPNLVGGAFLVAGIFEIPQG